VINGLDVAQGLVEQVGAHFVGAAPASPGNGPLPSFAALVPDPGAIHAMLAPSAAPAPGVALARDIPVPPAVAPVLTDVPLPATGNAHVLDSLVPRPVRMEAIDALFRLFPDTF
jgi:hypothetical protein